MLISNKLHSFRNFSLQKYEKQRKHTKEKLQVRRPHIPHNRDHNRPPNCNPNSNSNRTRLPRHLRTPSRTPGPHTENSGPRTPKLRLRLVARKEGFGNPKPSFTPDGPEAVPVNIEIPYPRNESRIPAATAEPTTPATLGPMACISR